MTAVVAVGGLGLAGGSAPATAAVSGPIDCPTALPTDQAVDGLTGTGYTVSKGTTPAAFTAKVLGRITDGVAPGVDMIMAELDSKAITDAGGIWAGISGSPVYTSDGKLIGSVSYGLASSGPIAGLTPGPDLNKVYSAKGISKAARTVKVSKKVAKRIAATGDVSAAEASQGFKALDVAVSISGFTRPREAKAVSALSKKLGTPVHTGGDRASGVKAAATGISAASNFAAAISYGDVSLTGVGTTTTVCNGKAVAFGHPFGQFGKTQLSAHTADAVYIQRDDVYGSFKVANVGGVVGVVDRDLTTGIRANLGATPTTYPITTSFSQDGDTPVTGKTTGVLQYFAPSVAFDHVLQALDGNGGYWQGAATATTTVTGTRAGGKPFSVTLKDSYADQGWVAIGVADSAASIVASLQGQSWEPVQINSVDVSGQVSQTFKQWHVNNVRVLKKGKWVKGSTINAKAGSTIKLRVSLSKYQSEDEKFVTLSVKIPTKASGNSGSLFVNAGFGGDFGEFSAAGARKQVVKGAKFDALLKELGKPVNTALTATLDLSPAVAKPVETTKYADATVEGYGKEYTVNVL